MKSICVFCGSSSGDNPNFLHAANDLGKYLAENKIKLVYGGASVGLMGAIANSVLINGGQVIGVLPRFLQSKEIAHDGLSELIVCNSMHERKTKMFELAEGFIALPGGYGTLEEVLEMLTWQQLGLHKFPIGFLNVDGFYNCLITFFDEIEKTKLLNAQNRKMALFSNTITDLIFQMQSYKAPEVEKWINKSTS